MTEELQKKLQLATSRAIRLKSARDQAEALLEEKSRELYVANSDLEKAQKGLEFDIQQATYELKVSNQRLQKALNERSTFIGQMSHEVRTPLNAIEGLSEILLGTPLDATQMDYVDTINNAARSLTVLIDDMLDITKIEAGKVKVIPTAVDLIRLHKSVVSMFALEASTKGLDLQLEIDENLPEKLMLDKGRYRQILSNLISNAVRYTDQGHILVTTSFKKTKAGEELDEVNNSIPHGKLTVTVKDTGVGINEKQLKRIFNAYAQLGTSSKGVGLGLAICSQLSDLMKGNLSCQSEVGKGSVFELSLPVQIADLESRDDSQIAKPEKSVETKLKILIAEDNLTNQKVIKAQLAQLNQQADIVDNGAQAIAKLKEQSYDIVLLDILMPVMDGEQTIEAIRSSRPRIAQHYCVALTASSYQDQRERLLNLGFDEFLSKPLSLQNLSAVLGSITIADHQTTLETVKQAKANPVNEFDLSYLREQFAEVAETIFMDIAPTFLDSSASDFGLLKAAIEQERIESIRKLSHSIKGAALSFGLTDLAGLLEHIEMQPDSIDVHGTFIRAETVWQTVSLEISALLERLT